MFIYEYNLGKCVILQVWILACITFVFITVLEYTYILFLMRRAKRKVLNKKKIKKKPAAPAPAAAQPAQLESNKYATGGKDTLNNSRNSSLNGTASKASRHHSLNGITPTDDSNG